MSRSPATAGLGGLAAGPAGLVGREEEVARLRGLVAALADGRGGSVWVDGEPGIGKSALLVAGLADAEQLGCLVYAARADETAAWFPLRVLLDALQVGPDSVDAGRAEIAALLWAEGFSRAVTPGDVVASAAERLLILVDRLCAAAPVVLALDDVQWADEMSLAVWGRLRGLVGQLPLLLVAACRPVPARAGVDRLRHAAAGEGARIELGTLAEAQVVELVGRLFGATAGPRLRAQAGQAGGNPLYVVELVDALRRERRLEVAAGIAELVDGDVAPASLTAAIADRLGFLSEQATAVLRMAALLGMQFSVEHLGVLTARPATELVDAVQEAVAAGAVAESGAGLTFRHALIRQALYRGMPAGLRLALHRQAARALAEAGAPAEQVAEQLLAVPHAPDRWVAGWLADAAAALSQRAPHVAVDLLTRVREAVGADDPGRERLDAQLATALFQLGRYEQVEQVAAPVLTSARDAELAGRMAWALGYALMRLGEHERALAVTDQALRERGLTAVWTARVRALRALILQASERYDQAEALAAQAEADGRRAADRLAVGYALHALSMLEVRHQHDETASLATIDRALAVIGEEEETTDLRLLLLGNRGSALANLDRLADANLAVGQAVALAERAGAPPRLARLRTLAADLCFQSGRWDDALAELDAAADLPPSDIEQLWRQGLLALIAVHRDDRAAASRHLRGVEDVQTGDGDVRYYAQHLLVAWALAAERDGHPGQALARLLVLLDPESTLQFPELALLGPLEQPDVVRLAMTVGDRAVAEAAADACAADASRQPLPMAFASAEHCRGLLAGDPAMVRSAAETYGDVGRPLYRAQALENAAVLLAGRGDPPAARAARTDALRIYTSLDAIWDILRADARLRPLGIRRGVRGPRHRPTHGWDALTTTELKIADLVAAGNSNAGIATELFLSRATVNTHISHILSKLDAHSRVDIAREVTSRRRQPRLTTAS